MITETTNPETIPTAATIEYTPHFVLSQESGTRKTYTMADARDGEFVAVEAIACERGQLTKLWKKHGYTSEELPTYWSINVYAYDSEGCHGYYNPTEKLHESGTRLVIDFKWKLEATAANLCKILEEVHRRYMAGEKLAV